MVGIIANRDKDAGLAVCNHIREMFIANGKDAIICAQEKNGDGFRFTNPQSLPKDLELIVTVGGDGTLIEAVRDLGSLKLPIIGVNMGTLGFLAELDVKTVDDAIAKLCHGEYKIEEHMMIKADIIRDGEIIASDHALNDAVISKSGHTHLIHFEVSVNGSFLTEYHADGLIISTPTGSTAYNLSAGGPIVAPSASMFVMTPVCSHSFTSRSVVFPDESVISVKVKKKAGLSADTSSDCAVSFDGTGTFNLLAGDRVDIRKSEYVTRLIKMSNTSFIDVLRTKMQSL